MQKINLLGMNLTDYSLRESIGITDRFLGSGSLNTILFISAKMLVGAGLSEEQKEWVEDADLIIWSDAEIVRKAGIAEKNRIHEVENQEYVRELLRRLGRGKKPVYLLAESEEGLEKLKTDILFIRQDLKIVGSGIIDPEQEDWADEANRINSVAPAAILSRMEFSRQEKLMVEMRKFLNADIWVAFNNQMVFQEEGKFSVKKLLNKWYHLLFRKLLQEKDEEQLRQQSDMDSQQQSDIDRTQQDGKAQETGRWADERQDAEEKRNAE